MALPGGIVGPDAHDPMSEGSDTASSGSVQLRVERRARVDVGVAVRAMADLAWLGAAVDVTDGEPGIRRVEADLELPIRDASGPGTVRKSALIDLGPARRVGDQVIVSVAWRSATVAPLFPVFAGELVMTGSGLTIEGWYSPPFGRIGMVIDGALLHVVARRTTEAFLARIESRVAR